MEAPIITVIIPTNRTDGWLDLAVESVLAESVPGMRLSMVFDGVDVPRDRAWARDPRVRLFHEPESRGPSSAMNRAMREADTPYVARLDSDDVDAIDRLSRQVAYLDAHPETVAVSARTVRIDETGVRTGEITLPAGPDIRRHLLLANVVPHSTLTFRRAVALDVGGYAEAMRQMEDYDFILRLALRGPIAQLPERLVEYRVHAHQTSRGAPAVGDHIAAVRRGRQALASELGVNRVRATAEHAVWLGVQHLRARGVIRPGHAR